MSTPQSVTERYISNLLHYGRNKEFDIESIDRKPNIVEDETVGYYFRVCVRPATDNQTAIFAAGATVAQATRRALEKAGVTFR